MTTTNDPPETRHHICSICQREFIGWSNNAQPVNDGECCRTCNETIVTPARITLALRAERLVWNQATPVE
jgi:hypothetical protein